MFFFVLEKSNRSSEQGSAMISVMMGVALAGLLSITLGTVLVSSVKRVGEMTTAADMRDIRLYVSHATDCAQTRAFAASCNAYIALVDREVRHSIVVSRFVSE